jgi:tetratricopeptide (TPR) repeat protein
MLALAGAALAADGGSSRSTAVSREAAIRQLASQLPSAQFAIGIDAPRLVASLDQEAAAVTPQSTLSAYELMLRGRNNFRSGRYAEAVSDFRTAGDSYLTPTEMAAYENTGHLETIDAFEVAMAYLALANARLGHDVDARDALLRLEAAERIEPRFATLKLDADLVELPAVATRVAPSLVLPANPLFGNAAPAAALSTSPSTPPVSDASSDQPKGPLPRVTPRSSASSSSGAAIPDSAATATTAVPAPNAPVPVAIREAAIEERIAAIREESEARIAAEREAAQLDASTRITAIQQECERRTAALRHELTEQIAVARRESAEQVAAAKRESSEQIAAARHESEEASRAAAVGSSNAPAVAQTPSATPLPDFPSATVQSATETPLDVPAEPAPRPTVTLPPEPLTANAAPAPAPILTEPVTPERPQMPEYTIDRTAATATLRAADADVESGRFDAARSAYVRLATAAGASREIAGEAATGLYRIGAYREAVEAFQHLGALQRGEEDLRYYYAVSLFESGQYNEARRELACALPYIQATDDVIRYRSRIEQMADDRNTP